MYLDTVDQGIDMNHHTTSKYLSLLGSPILREVIPEIEEITDKEIQLISRMKYVCNLAGGYAIAANQVGVKARIFVYQDEGKYKTIINPMLGEYDNEFWRFDEGCLSIPGHTFEIWRPREVVIRGIDENGKNIKFHARDLLGRIMQHEVDHLSGILVIDHLTIEEQEVFYRKWNKKNEQKRKKK